MTRKYLIVPLMAGILGIASASLAQAAQPITTGPTTTEPTTAELMKQIQALQAKVQTLENNQQQAVTKADVDATDASVLKDADKQSQLMQVEGFTAGWTNGHFILQSADGNFKIIPMIQWQFRNTTNWRESGKASGSDDLENGFENARIKGEVAGNLFTPDFTYDFRTSNLHGLENAYVQYKFADAWSIRAGQFKDDWSHEESVDSRYQMAADRSLMNQLIGGGQTNYVQGVTLLWDGGGPLRAALTYHDGYDSLNTSFQDEGGNGDVGVTPTDFGITARVEYAILGNYKGYDQFTANGNTDDLLVVGAGVDWSQGSSNDAVFHTADIQWDPQAVKGLSMYAGYVGLYRDFNDATDNDFYDWGVIAQAGYMLNNKWEVFGRYDYTDLDKDALPAGSESSVQEITAGVNYYMQTAPWAIHNAKFTIDCSWLPNGCPVDESQLDFLASGSHNDEIVIRGQFQLLL